MLRSQMFGHGSGVEGLVPRGHIEPNRIRMNRAGRAFPHQRDDQAGVDAARQQATDRHVGHGANPDGIAQQGVQLFRGRGLTAVPGIEAAQCDVLAVPIRVENRGKSAVPSDRKHLAGGQFAGAGEDGSRAGHVTHAQEIG